MKFRHLKVTLSEALSRNYISIKDIAGKNSWRGMRVSFKNLTRFTGIEVIIPAHTIFREKSGRYQQMMALQDFTVYVPPAEDVTHELDEVVCTQPLAKVPPPRIVTIPKDLLRVASIPEGDFEQTMTYALNEGQFTSEDIILLRQGRQELLTDAAVRQLLNQGGNTLRNEFSYEVIAPASLPEGFLSDAFHGIAVNNYRFGHIDQALSIFKIAAQTAPEYKRQYYELLATFVEANAGHEKVLQTLMLSCGSQQQRAAAEVMVQMVLDGEINLQTFPTRKPHSLHNAKYAGKVYPVKNLKYPNGVYFNEEGFPDFTPYAIKTVTINVTGNRIKDFRAANAEAGFIKTPDNYSWHHHEDCTTMQLVPIDLHKEVRHSGGVSIKITEQDL